MSEKDLSQLKKLNYLDQACILENRLKAQHEKFATKETKEPLAEVVRKKLDTPYYAPQHAMLQALPGKEIITTNYDTLIEKACASAGKSVTVLPYQDYRESKSISSKWLLKLHGCIFQPEDIVLTREDYIRYHERRQALAGIVQAQMITRHMLFVGFSLSDNNFFNIASTVKKALASPKYFGTSIQLIRNPFLEELWQEDIRMINMLDETEISGNDATAQDFARAGRRVEIFLDYLVGESLESATHHLLDPAFHVFQSPGEALLAKLLRDLINQIREEESKTGKIRKVPAWGMLEKLLLELGAKEEDLRSVKPRDLERVVQKTLSFRDSRS
eukprot:TRINITY_DN6594_c0_g1_i1.p1 TRINITY_DN6594_c0_g1~~TRINITY_DN6594_c0_g1_i1.p1  ORF type:complete len:331 (-),score=82.83 TRINITY_DN6594_c0_g1_i1:14-1006(-)